MKLTLEIPILLVFHYYFNKMPEPTTQNEQMFSLIMISVHCHLALLFGAVVVQSAMVDMTSR